MNKDKERYLENKAKREEKKRQQELALEEVTEEEQQNLVENFMKKLGKIPFINDLAETAVNRLERRRIKKAEKRGMKIAKQMQEDRELSRQLFMQTLLEKVKAKNEEITRQGGKKE